MTIEPTRLREEIIRACEDAGINPRSVVIFIVDAERPAGASPIAYLQPAGYVMPETARLFRAVGSERVHMHHLAAHRFAIWRELPGVPETALTPMLRHELEHAKRWERSGTLFFEADEWLRSVLPRGEGFEGAYAELPTERAANAASTAYAEQVLQPEQIAELLDLPDYRDLVSGAPVDGDVVELTFAALEAREDWGPGWFDSANRTEFIAGGRESVAEWNDLGAGVLETDRDEPLIEVVRGVERPPRSTIPDDRVPARRSANGTSARSTDGLLSAYWARPEAYLDSTVRANLPLRPSQRAAGRRGDRATRRRSRERRVGPQVRAPAGTSRATPRPPHPGGGTVMTGA